MEKKSKRLPWWTVLSGAELQRVSGLREAGVVFGAILLVWGIYRMLFRFPVWFEEGILKAWVFGLPVWWQARKHGWQITHLGISGDKLFGATYMGLLVGILLGMIGQLGNIIRHGGLFWSAYGLTSETIGAFIILSLVTAFWEQLLFSGYFLRVIFESITHEGKSLVVVAGMYVLLHLPALLMVQKLGGWALGLACLLLFVLQMGCSVLRLRVGNLAAPILVQALWGVTIYLFR